MMLKVYKNTLTTLFIIILIIVNYQFAQSELVVQRIEIKNDVCAFIYCSEVPRDFTSKLDETKTKIILTINNASVLKGAVKAHSSGLMKNIFIEKTGNNLKIMLASRQKTGYTCVPLPYSKILMIELFDWSTLNKADDNYRSGLLALEDGLFIPAENYLNLSAESGQPNAAAHLGITQLYNGKLKTAFKNLLFSQTQNTNIPDAHAALSQVFKMYGMNEKAQIHSKIFTNLTGLKSFPEIAIGEIQPNDSLDKETIEMLVKINSVPSVSSNSEQDSLKNRFNKVLSYEKNNKDNSTSKILDLLFPEWIFQYFIYILLAIILLAIILLVSFIKWRKKQSFVFDDKTIRINHPEFVHQVNNAQSRMSYSSKAAKIYKEAENAAESDTDIPISQSVPDIKKENSDFDIEKVIVTNPALTKSPDKGLNENNDNDDSGFGEKIDRIAKQLIAAQQKQTFDEYEKEIEEKQQNKSEGMNAKAKLAMHLQDKSLIEKQEILNKFDKEIPNDNKKITEIAQKMKIEKGSLETKKDISKIEQDKKLLSDLGKKFSGVPKDNTK